MSDSIQTTEAQPELSPAMDRWLYGSDDKCHTDDGVALQRRRRHAP